jgi:hypothetical protein
MPRFDKADNAATEDKMSRQIYMIGWAIVLGTIVASGHGNFFAFIAISQQPSYFASTAVLVWLFYSVPCAAIFVVPFIVRVFREAAAWLDRSRFAGPVGSQIRGTLEKAVRCCTGGTIRILGA